MEADDVTHHEVEALDVGVLIERKDMTDIVEAIDFEGVFDGVFEDLYPPGCANSPYEIETECGTIETRGWRESGVTIAMIDALCKQFDDLLCQIDQYFAFGFSEIS